MPLGSFNTTINMNNQNYQMKGGMRLNNFYPQNTRNINIFLQTCLYIVARSRLTRRQMSMSRRIPNKLQSSSNIVLTNQDEKDNQKKHSNDLQTDASQERQQPNQTTKKGIQIPKLNINSIIYDTTTMAGQRIDPLVLPTTSHQPLQTNIKSSTRSNRIALGGNTSQNRFNSTNMQNYQTNANVVRQTTVNQGGVGGESEHNISIYDEVNGSFIDDGGMAMMEGQNCLTFDNALEKLKAIAIQLGESCLTNDLAALISQKRDRELVESARKMVTIKERVNPSRQKQNSKKTVHRSISVTYSLETNLQINQEPVFMFKNNHREQQQQSTHEKLETEQGSSNFIRKRMRLIILNIIYKLLKKYDLEESRFLRSPIPVLMAYLSSTQFRMKRKNKQVTKLEIGANLKQQVKSHQKNSLKQGAESDSERSEDNVEINYEGVIRQDYFISQRNTQSSQLQSEQNSLTKYMRNRNDSQKLPYIVEQDDFKHTLTQGGGIQLNTVLEKNYSTNQSVTSQSQNLQNDEDSPLLEIVRQKSIKQLDKKLKLFTENDVFKITLIIEEKVIFKLFSKFSFVSEEMSRRQVVNEIASFALKDKGIDFKFYNAIASAKFNPNNSFLNGQGGGIGSLVGPPLPAPLSGTPIRQFNNLSFDDEQEDFYFKKEKLGDAMQLLSNPNCFWSNTGVAYEFGSSSSKSNSTAVSKERIRKKLDTLLYQVNRRLKYALLGPYEKTSLDFAQSINNEIVTLSSYLKEQSSRITLYQFIDVNLESILMVKKILIEIALKTNMFVMDYSKVPNPDLLPSAGNRKNKSPKSAINNQNLKYGGIYQPTISMLIETQKAHRELFSEFLRLVSILLRMPQTLDTLKLLNEVLIFDESWQESIKTYVISLFLQDLVGSLIINDKNQFHLKIIDDLNGVNLLNFDEAQFLSVIMVSQDINLYSQAKEAIFLSLLCALNVMRYYKSVTIFFQEIIKIYFSHQETTSKGKSYSESRNNNQEGERGRKNQMIGSGGGGRGEEIPSQKKLQNDQQFGIDRNSQKYWKYVIRKILYQYMFLITPPNGLLSCYLQTNAINYINILGGFGGEQDSMAPTPINRNFIQFNHNNHESDINAPCPINFQLTKYILNFMKTVFEIPDKFTKYVFVEELMLFYIRTHYISFVRLYNKNYSKKNNPQISKEASLTLCKKHLECLFAIARNRNEDTRRILYQFKVVNFLCQEIQLEYEIQQRRMKFIQLSKEEQEKQQQKVEKEEQKDQQNSNKVQQKKKANSMYDEETIKKIQGIIKEDQEKRELEYQDSEEQNFSKVKIKIRVSNPSVIQFSEPATNKNNDSQSNNTNMNGEGNKKVEQESDHQQIKNKLGFKIPKLKTEGLGLSELVKDEEQEKQVVEEVKAVEPPPPSFQAPQKGLGFKIPPLKIAGLGLSELIPPEKEEQKQQQQPINTQQTTIDLENINKPQQSEFNQEEQQKEQIPEKKIMKPMIPSLKIAGLGLTGIVPDEADQKQQQQNNDSSIIQPQEQNQPKPKMKIPLLNITGLGLSELTQNNQIQQQQQPVIQQLPNNQGDQKEAPPPIEQKVIQKPKIPALKIQGLGLSELVKDEKDSVQQIVAPPVQKEEKQAPPPVKQPPKIPSLKIDGLGLTGLTLGQEDQQKAIINNQEDKNESNNNNMKIPEIKIDQNNKTIDYGQQQEENQLFKKQQPQFDKTAPVQHLIQEASSSALLIKDEGSRGIKESQESAQFLNQSKSKVEYIPQDQVDIQKKIKLNQQRKNLMPPRNRNQSSSSKQSNEEEKEQQLQGQQLFEKKNFTADTQLTPLKQIKEENRYANTNFRASIQSMVSPNQLRVESIVDQNSVQQLQQTPINMNEGEAQNNSRNQLQIQTTSNNQNSACISPNNQSIRSNGSYVGPNQVFIPHLTFPNDINEDPSTKIKVYQKPEGDQRFKLMKTKDQVQTPDDQSKASASSAMFSKSRGGLGKKGKMLDINTSQQVDSANESSKSVPKSFISKFNFQMNEGLADQQQQALSISRQLGRSKNEENEEDEVKVEVYQEPKINRKVSVKLEDEEEGDQQIYNKSIVEASQQVKNINKKPFVPSLKIPEKGEQLEGKEKIKQQIETQEKLSVSVEAGNLTKLEMSLNQTNAKFQLLLDQRNKGDFSIDQSSQKQQQLLKELDPEIQMSEAMFYIKERGARPLYQDEELHVLMLSLIMCLLLKPQRGTLDEYYCSQYPIDNGKQNILYLLHFHLNNQENIGIVPNLLQKVAQITPQLAGQRLMKLLCAQLFDLSMYNNGKDWKKIGEGAYAKVYECQMSLSEPQQVAIKQMHLPSSIYDRCVLHDIFTEITCLEEFRLEACVTDLYDYGVDGYSYYIVMKKYAFSLNEWRRQQQKPISENLSLYLSIYKEVLKAFAIIHSHNVTHYDIKNDNVLIDMGTNFSNNSKWAIQDEERMKITIGDFGECRMFLNEKDEFCSRNRGTDYIKSPEMLELAVNTRKDTDKYDRRKQVGTNRLSDIWSLGCLFYELLTGEYLFQEQDYIIFFMRVTRPNEQLLTNEKLAKIGNNTYLVDFLKYMLVRDAKLRPPIESVLKRFEHVHALLVPGSSANGRFNITSSNGHSLRGQASIENLLEQATQIMVQNSQVFGGEIKEENVCNFDQEQVLNVSDTIHQYDDGQLEMKNKEKTIVVEEIQQKPLYKQLTSLMQIMGDIYLSSVKWVKKNMDQAVQKRITHLVIESQFVTQSLKDRFEILEIPEFSEYLQHNNQELKMNPFLLLPMILDFLRKASLQKGNVLFVEGPNKKSESVLLNSGIKYQLIRESLLLALNYVFQTSSYETFTLIRSQNLFFSISSERLSTISKWSLITSKIKQYIGTYPRFSCMCGSCVITLKRQFANYNNLQTINCICCQFYKNIETSQCPSPGCNEFIQYMKQFFKVQLDSLHWGFLEEDDFLLGPNYLGSLVQNSIFHRQILSNMTQTIDHNSQVASIIEKKSGGMGKDVINQEYNLISKSSATAKNYHYMGYARWKLFKCKECHVWTHAVNETENRYALLLNNRIKDEMQANIGILSAKKGNTGVRVPILEKIKLKLPF